MITLKLIILIVVALGGVVAGYLFIRNNPKKTAKIEEVIDVIKKKD